MQTPAPDDLHRVLTIGARRGKAPWIRHPNRRRRIADAGELPLSALNWRSPQLAEHLFLAESVDQAVAPEADLGRQRVTA